MNRRIYFFQNNADSGAYDSMSACMPFIDIIDILI